MPALGWLFTAATHLPKWTMTNPTDRRRGRAGLGHLLQPKSVNITTETGAVYPPGLIEHVILITGPELMEFHKASLSSSD